MEHLNIFIAQLAILLLPGIIWARLDARFAAREKLSEFEFVIQAFLYGLVSYAVIFVIFSLFKIPFVLIDVSQAQEHNIFTQQVGLEIISATIVGLVLSIAWIYASNHKWISRLLQSIGATKRYGDEDVWDFTFNSPDKSVNFVTMRDFDKKITYTGWVTAFSETGSLRELTLLDVELYDFDGNFMYRVPHIYLARKPDDIHIEFPLVNQASK